MVILGTVKSVTDTREVEFQKRDGSKEKASVQGFIVKSCDDEVYVEGFGDVVKSLKEGGLQEGDILRPALCENALPTRAFSTRTISV